MKKGDLLFHWEKQEVLLQPLRHIGTEKFFTAHPRKEHIFRLKDRSVRCIDEGTPGGIHIAGSGILLGEERTLRVFEKARPDGVFSHEECGAAALWASRNGKDTRDAGKYAEEWAKKIAHKAGIPYEGYKSSWLMMRPRGLHIARVVYVDGTGRFDPRGEPDLPAGFQVHWRYLDPGYAAEEIEISISIAFGEHGFGKLFTRETPLIMVLLGDPSDNAYSIKTLMPQMLKIAKDQKYDYRVAVDGFDVPSEWQ